MAGKLSELVPPLTAAGVAADDIVEVLDVSDTTMAPTGTNKPMALSELAAYAGASGGGSSDYSLPTGAKAQVIDRHFAANNVAAGGTTAAGRLGVWLISLKAGTVINSITFVSGGTAAGTPTNQWFALFDVDGVMVARTADDTSNAWNANTAKTLAIAQIASGAASSYTVPADGPYYVGAMVAAATMPSLAGYSAAAGVQSGFGITPKIGHICDSGMTTPPSFPFTFTATGTVTQVVYAYVS